ncbi:hypothetical protein RclHR1_10630004 [Rhizophagus clarus]|uniref:Uncharacterized protein n=1 Tax=Rhizophagus clarus TaxID=94130 RepID=A0A2Z6QUR8_9GLOM|nr:hypothetical protein RclHR1_10630004 [Rhizophagus clarus]
MSRDYYANIIFNKQQKVIACFKSEDGLMRALGKTILKDTYTEQWQVQIQNEKFKKRKIQKFKKTKKDMVMEDGSNRKDKNIEL